MRNVVKGFQFSQMAVPKMHENNLNASFNNFHTPNAPRAPTIRTHRIAAGSSLPKPVKRPGKNVAIKGGYKV